jgi:hypothetical protein
MLHESKIFPEVSAGNQAGKSLAYSQFYGTFERGSIMRLLFSCVLSVTVAFASLALDRRITAPQQQKDAAHAPLRKRSEAGKALTGTLQTAEQKAALELAGLWEAKRRFGPDVRGTLRIRQAGDAWWAELAGRTAQAKVASEDITFELPGRQGSFNGRFEARRAKIVGQWIQPQTIEGGPFASPITLTRFGRDEWRGNVSPLEGTLTFYLMVKGRDDGSTGAFLRNPERNLGFTQFPVDQIQRAGDSVRLLAANKGSEQGRVLAEGRYDAEREILTINLRNRSGFYDFRRVAPDETSDFYPRGRPDAAYDYAPPPAFDDGWQTASLEDVGISRPTIESFIRMLINKPIDSARSPAVHGILIARHGKLVLEEYFYGEHREKPHDTRSASKSLAADMAGAVINSGVRLNASSAVYSVMNDGALPPGLEPRKRALTLEHVLTMSSGFDCTESDENSPGYEDRMWEQTEQPDFYKFTMDLKMVRDPGEKAVYYCRAAANQKILHARDAQRRVLLWRWRQIHATRLYEDRAVAYQPGAVEWPQDIDA